MINAQGEDVVAGTRTPQYITKKAKIDSGSTSGRNNAKSLPATRKNFYQIRKTL